MHQHRYVWWGSGELLASKGTQLRVISCVQNKNPVSAWLHLDGITRDMQRLINYIQNQGLVWPKRRITCFERHQLCWPPAKICRFSQVWCSLIPRLSANAQFDVLFCVFAESLGTRLGLMCSSYVLWQFVWHCSQFVLLTLPMTFLHLILPLSLVFATPLCCAIFPQRRYACVCVCESVCVSVSSNKEIIPLYSGT